MPARGLGVPRVAVPALSGGLPPGQHDAARRQPGGRAHGGIDCRVVLDAAAPGSARADAVSMSIIRQLQPEADVHGARGVRDGAGGNEVRAGFGVGAHVFERDAAGEFHLGAAGDLADPVGRFGGREVVQQQVGGAALQRLAQFFARAHFDFDGQPGQRARAPMALRTPPAAAMWLFLIRIASNRPMRWLVTPPAAAACFSSARSPGVVLRVSSTRQRGARHRVRVLRARRSRRRSGAAGN